MPVVFWKSSTAAPSETMTSFPTYRMPYIHPAKHLVMEPLATIIDRLSAEKRLVVRRAESLSWGDRERCEALFREIFRRVDRTVVRYRPLPEYASVIGWMTATDGRGLLLWGDCGRGKSTILTGVIPVLLAMKGFHACPVHADELTKPYRFAASTAGCDSTCLNLDFLTRAPFPIIDEVGVEPLINDYGERYEGFNRIVNAAERRLRPLFLATNLSKEQLLRRYGERTFDRLTRLCRAVEFRGESLR